MSSSYSTGVFVLYHYNPNQPANAVFASVMGFSLVAQIVMTFKYRSWWFGSCFILGTVAEYIGYIARCMSYYDTTNLSKFLAQSIPLVFAPVFFMAGVYYIFALLIVIYGSKYSLIKPMLCSWIFIVGDVVSLFVQAGGGGLMAAGSNAQLGQNIALAGVVFQLVVMGIFVVLFTYFLYKIHFLRDQSNLIFNEETELLRSKKEVKYYPFALLVVVALIAIRSVFRLVEFEQGNDGMVSQKEIWILMFDSLMIAISVLIFTFFHPGRVLGRDVTPKGITKRRSIEKGKQEFELQHCA
jgi:hypothetical protein